MLPGMWAWDYLYSYLFEYYIYSDTLDDDSGIMLSVVQYTDTGFFDSETDDKLDIANFERMCYTMVSKSVFLIFGVVNRDRV